MTSIVALGVYIGLVAAGGPPMIGLVLGVVAALLAVSPQRRLLKELGLTTVEAKRILAAERERRAGSGKSLGHDRSQS
ncbi:hypothetical protein [Cellulomonas sp. URHD0024]|uniref:hypothetical protein n=1 Tax=Cellulomonas sp. URHD0024 TaxID=1302620 RepID=UPI00040BD4F5|nr:hypothetical protein [Cellulomonas sp. URHD0024]